MSQETKPTIESGFDDPSNPEPTKKTASPRRTHNESFDILFAKALLPVLSKDLQEHGARLAKIGLS